MRFHVTREPSPSPARHGLKRTILHLLGAVALGAALNLHRSTSLAQITTFTNPTPAAADGFGNSVAALGTDRVLIGAWLDDAGAKNAGTVYLLSTNGTVLTVFTNPTPAFADGFGWAVAALGTDRVLIGAHYDDIGATDSGAAYLFGTNGQLITTFTNPAPTGSGYFGLSVAAVGTDRVLIGAPRNRAGTIATGAAYLFSTNGTRLTTITNPSPEADDRFGAVVAALGADRVVIGAPDDNTHATKAGAAYLFSTEGVLLTTFSNPTPAAFAYFGISVAAVGTDRVLIGAWFDNAIGSDAGGAYLFRTNGAWLTRFSYPKPGSGDYFGTSLCGVGTDRVLIGAPYRDTGATDAGTAYLFSTTGALLTTFTNPTPVVADYFGSAVAPLGSDHVLIGAPSDYSTFTEVGSAYLLSLEAFPSSAPLLSIQVDSEISTVTLSWSASAGGWRLESAHAPPFLATISWVEVPPPYTTNGETISVTHTLGPEPGGQVFRLHKL